MMEAEAEQDRLEAIERDKEEARIQRRNEIIKRMAAKKKIVVPTVKSEPDIQPPSQPLYMRLEKRYQSQYVEREQTRRIMALEE